MKLTNVVIESFGVSEPEFFMSSDELESKLQPVYDRLKLPEGRIELQTGIKSRGFWKPGTKPSSIATIAAINCLKDYPREKIGLLIHASVCRDFLEPATASVVHSNLKLSSSCQFFDLSNACLGVVTSMMMAGSLIEAGTIESALIVSGENSGPLILNTIKTLNTNLDLNRQTVKPYFANFTIGSAGVAILLTRKKASNNKPEFLGGHTLTDSSANHLCQGSGDLENLVMETNSEELLKVGIALAQRTYSSALDYFEIKKENIDVFIPHQVGDQHLRFLLSSLKLEDSKIENTFSHYGNTGSAALPMTLIKAYENNSIKKNDLVALLGIGSGLVSTIGLIRWNE
jgi:3-oxoacyl-[acyl-carrier-protein] synthase III